MKYFRRHLSYLALSLVVLKLAFAARDLYPAAENAIAASTLEQALYRLMTLPAGAVLARRSPAESRPQMDALIRQSASDADLYAVRAQEDERQLDFVAAEADWKRAAELSREKQRALLSLAEFYHRRLQPQQEIQALLQSANLPASPSDEYKIYSQQLSWTTFHRALNVASDSNLLEETRKTVCESWIGRYPKQTEPLEKYFDLSLASKDRATARTVAARIRSVFPDNLALKLETDSKLAELEQGNAAAMSVYDTQFSPLWPADLRNKFYTLLSNAHQLRTFLADARARAAANPVALDPALRLFFYYEQEGKRDIADQQLLELEARRGVAKDPWTVDALKTLGALFLRVADYDEAAHAYYSLYALPSAATSDRALAMASLIDLLLDVPEQPLQFGTRDLSIYRNVAAMDRHPGFLNGILSLLLNTTFPGDQYQTASQTSVAYFHRATASRLIARMRREFPGSKFLAARESKLFSAYAVYGQNDALIRLAPVWLTANRDSSEYSTVALLLASAYAQAGQTTQEFALYDGLLQKLAVASGHRPIGDASNSGQNQNEEGKAIAPRSPEYAHVLDLYISRLTQLGRLTDAVALYRRELDRNPDDPGIYERLALFVEQNHLDSELEQTYRAAMKRFDSTSWPDKLARLYLRKRQTAAYQDLAKELTGKFDGTKLAAFISAVRPGPTFSAMLYRQVNLYAHQRFPHNLTFVRNLLASYQSKGFLDMPAYESLLRQNWFYDPSLRTSFFEYLSRTNKLSAELSALPKLDQAIQQKNTAALTFYGEGKAWLSDFEDASPAFVALAAAAPGDEEYSTRAISIERSLASSVPAAFDTAVRLAEEKANATPGDPAAATLVGEIYADRELFAKAAPWWNKIATMRPGVKSGYLDSATVFWDYFQFSDSLRVLQNVRRVGVEPSLYAYQMGAIYESQNDYQAAIEEYLQAIVTRKTISKRQPDLEGEPAPETRDDSGDMPQERLIQLAKRKQTSVEIEQRTAALAEAKPFNAAVFNLRLALLEDQSRRADVGALLMNSLDKISDLDHVELIRTSSERLGFEDVSAVALQRAVALNTDPVDKLTSRLALARFYQAHRNATRAESEFASLLSENLNLLGIVRANTDFYWTEKQPKKAIAILESAASRAQPPYRDQFRREAAQKAADSSDFNTARRLLDALLTSDPYNGDLLAAKAATYAREGDNQGLISFYAAQLDRLKAAPLSADEKIQRTASLRRGYINALITAKQFDSAIEQYQALLNVYPEDESLAREMGQFAETNHLTERLTKYYEKATADSPRDYRWPMVLARIDKAVHRYSEAVAALDKAVYIRPDRSDLFIAKADLETRLLRFDAAIKTYQKLYETSYHDSQYLAAQASLQARLGHKAEAAGLLKAAYVDAQPNELNGYVSAMSELSGWRMYAEVDQIYQQAKPYLKPGNGDYQKMAILEGQALIALRRSGEALEAVSYIRQATSDPKHPWMVQRVTDALGAKVDDFYTPEEKASFAAKLETPKAFPPDFNIYQLARASGFAELTAKRLYVSARARPSGSWRNLEQLQTSRLLDSDLARQLETLKPVMPAPQADALTAATLAAYARAGDSISEIRLYQARLATGAGIVDPAHYAQLLLGAKADLPDQVRQLSAVNPGAANQLAQELLSVLPEDRALPVIEARGANISNLWTRSYSALADLYFSSAKATAQFDGVLGPRTVGSQISTTSDALRGAVWYYYAARYSDYLTARKDAGAADLRPATVETSPMASNRYVELGQANFELGQFAAASSAYQQALELSPGRADVHVLLAEVEHADHHAQESIAHLRTAFELLTKQVDQSRQSPGYYETAKTALTRMNEYQAVAELRPAVDAMLSANSKRNQSDQFLFFVEGILSHASDRKAALVWIIQLAHTADLTGLPDQLLAAALLSEPEKQPLYVASIDLKRAEMLKAAGDAEAQAHETLQNALANYASYLNRQGHVQDAWQVVNEMEPKTERPAPLLLELAAMTGRLNETLSQYDAGLLDAPTGEQILTVASDLSHDHPDLAWQLREYEYNRELRAGTATASTYFGLAQVRIAEKRTTEALALLREVTLTVGAPFENVPAAVALLEKAGLKQNAADYAREWRSAEPWNAEAILAVGRLTGDQGLLESVRKSDSAEYSVRAAAARGLRDLKWAAAGNAELDLLTRPVISPQEAEQPFFVLARVRAAQLTQDQSARAKLYSEVIALKPSLRTQRMALAEAAILNKQDALGLAAWQSYGSHRVNDAGLHSSSLDEALDTEADRTLAVEELVAGVLTKRQQYAGAEALYTRMLQQTHDSALAARVEKLKDKVSRAAQLELSNRSRAPTISTELTQAGVVKPKLMGGSE